MLAFALPATLQAAPHSRHRHHARFAGTAETAINPAIPPGALVYHVRSGQLDFGDHFYDASSGNRAGFNNPKYQRVQGTGPIPIGTYKIGPHDGLFFNEEAWSVLHTPKRTHILIHTDDVHLLNRPIGETKGCIAVNSDQWEDFKAEMHKAKPSGIVVIPY